MKELITEQQIIESQEKLIKSQEKIIEAQEGLIKELMKKIKILEDLCSKEGLL